MSDTKNYVRVDEHGAMRIGNTRVMLDSIVVAFEQGHSAETIRQQFPALSLEEFYGAITYYLSHLEEVSSYLEQQSKLWEEWKARSTEKASPLVERLRRLRSGF